MNTRVFGMRIVWHDAPREFMVLTSYDQNNWTVQNSWSTPFKEPVDELLACIKMIYIYTYIGYMCIHNQRAIAGGEGVGSRLVII